MRIFSSEDRKAYDQFKKNMMSGSKSSQFNSFKKPQVPLSKDTITMVRRLKNILVLGVIIGSVEGGLYLYNKYNKESWEIQPFDINKQIQKKFNQSSNQLWKIGLNIFSDQQELQLKLNKAFLNFYDGVNNIYKKIQIPPPSFKTQLVSIQRKVNYKIFYLEFGIKEKIRQITPRGHLVQTDRKILMTIFGVPLFVTESTKIIKVLKTLALSKSYPLGISNYLIQLTKTAKRSIGHINQQNLKLLTKDANYMEQSILIAYEINR